MWTNDSDEAIYVDASKTHVVPGESPDAAFLLVSPHGEIPEDEANRCGLIEAQRRQREEAEMVALKAAKPSRNKAVEPEANK